MALVGDIDRTGQLLARLGRDAAFDIDFGILVENLDLLAGRRIELDQRRLVAADIRGRDQMLVVEGEEVGPDIFAEIGLDDRLERVLLARAIEQLGVDAVGLGLDPDHAAMIGGIAVDRARILHQQIDLAGLDIRAQRVERLGIALIVHDDDVADHRAARRSPRTARRPRASSGSGRNRRV
jgi:hypothetical protein